MNSDILLYCPMEGCNNTPFSVTQDDLNEAYGIVECEYCGGNCLAYSVGITLTVGELKAVLNEFSDDTEIYCKPSNAVGNTGAIRRCRLTTSVQFGENKTALVFEA